MQKIEKLESPNFWDEKEYIKKYNNWNEFSRENLFLKEKLRKYILEKEQKFSHFYFCCYCDKIIFNGNNINSNIEHFLPRDFFQNKQFSYNNLLVSCNYVKSCGKFKKNKNTPILNPSKHKFTDYLEYKITDNGIEIVTKNNLNLKYKELAENTIKILNLNERKLVEYRLSFFIKIKKTMIIDYAEIHPALLNFLQNYIEF